jgi:ribosome-associated toxin RatA of RatAB toxin-antitoxin module
MWYFVIGLCNCSDNVLFCDWIVKLFWECGIFRLDHKIPHCQNSYTIQSQNTTLLEQLHNPVEKYHTVRTVTQSNRKIPHCQNNYTIQSKNTTLSKQLHNPIKTYNTVRTVTQSNHKIPHCQNSYTIQSKTTTVRTVTQSNRKIPHCQNSYTIQSKNTTLSEQLHNPIEKYHTVRTVTQSNHKIPHCQNSYTIQSQNTVYLFWQCGIFRLYCVTVLTMWYFSIGLCNCSNSVVFFDWIL